MVVDLGYLSVFFFLGFYREVERRNFRCGDRGVWLGIYFVNRDYR